MNLWSHCFSKKNMNAKLSWFLPCSVRAEILTIFCSYFGRNDDFINSFWSLLTFRGCLWPSSHVRGILTILALNKCLKTYKTMDTASLNCFTTAGEIVRLLVNGTKVLLNSSFYLSRKKSHYTKKYYHYKWIESS